MQAYTLLTPQSSSGGDVYSSPPLSANSTTQLCPPDVPYVPPKSRRRPDESDSQYEYLPPYSAKRESRNTRRRSLIPIQLTLPKFGTTKSNQSLKGFERPDFTQLALHMFVCITAYPVMYILSLVASDRSVFVVRLLVASGSAIVGFCLAISLVAFAVKYIEAATWATVIHLSYIGDGMELRDLANITQSPSNFEGALKLLWTRLKHPGTARHSRRSFDKRPWSLFIIFFMVLMVVSPLIPLAFGRIMVMNIMIRNQRTRYREVSITGDLSVNDVSQASSQSSAFTDYVRTWTLVPFSQQSATTVQFPYGDEPVYFAQANSSQFLPGGYGLGTFNLDGPTANSTSPNDQNSVLPPGDPGDSAGVILKYPQWGIRIHCEKLPDPTTYLVPFSNMNFTYAFLTQSFLQSLFSSFDLELPQELRTPYLSLLDANDTIPSNINNESLAYIIKWWDNGVGHSFKTIPIPSMSDQGQGWTSVETGLIRLNNSYTPNGTFPVYGAPIPDINGTETRIGYDAVVCVERYEPWIVETYNSSIGSPTALRLVGKPDVSLTPESMMGKPILGTRVLSSTNKDPAFTVAHDNGINQILKDNGLDRWYVPSPTAVSYTDGAGPEGYLELSASRFASARGRTDAANVLPFLVGSGTLVAYSYPDETLASVEFEPWQMITFLTFIAILGVIAALCVPVLPFSIPRRGFGLYSWLTVLQSQELRVELEHELGKRMDLEEVEQRTWDKIVKYSF